MFLLLLAEAPAAADAAPTQVSPIVVAAPAPATKAPVVIGSAHDWMYRAPGAEILSVWPAGAYQARISGSATLDCRIDAHGLAEDCAVVSETPRGKGFGRAALLLRTTFKLDPATGPDGGPVASRRTLTVKFDAEDNDQIEFHQGNGMPGIDTGTAYSTVNFTRPEMREVTILDHPVWARAASFADVARAYPVRGGGVEGFAVAHCRMKPSGGLAACEVRKEEPADRGFGAAAVGLAARFRVGLDGVTVPRGPPVWVDIPFRFPPPGSRENEERAIAAPTWLTGLDPTKSLKLFPPEAVAKGITTGRGVARCVVAPDGSLTACQPAAGDPEGLGFSQAAVKLASVMRMNPWTADGRPVDGAVIRLPIRLNLATPK